MAEFTVHLIQTVSTAVHVQADDIDEAIEQAYQVAPSPTNATNHGIDSTEWHEVSVVDEDGNEVWTDETDYDLLRRAEVRLDRALEALKAAGANQTVLDAVMSD